MKTKQYAAFVALAVLAVAFIWRPWSPRGASASGGDSSPPVLWPMPVFNSVDQDHQSVTNSSLRGKVWICDFFLTNCYGICPRMTDAMRALQQRVKGQSVHFVSFSVDPERDTPEVLKDYAKSSSLDLSNWQLLTTPRAEIQEAAVALGITSAAAASGAILHSERFFLIDQQGNVRGVFDSKDTRQMDQLVADTARLLGSSGGAATPMSAAPTEMFTVGPTSVGVAAEAMARDLVCEMDVAACSISPSAIHDGRSYYFCSDRCKTEFEKSPAKYLQRR